MRLKELLRRRSRILQRTLTEYCEEGKTAEEKGMREQYIRRSWQKGGGFCEKVAGFVGPVSFYSEAKENPE